MLINSYRAHVYVSSIATLIVEMQREHELCHYIRSRKLLLPTCAKYALNAIKQNYNFKIDLEERDHMII